MRERTHDYQPMSAGRSEFEAQPQVDFAKVGFTLQSNALFIEHQIIVLQTDDRRLQPGAVALSRYLYESAHAREAATARRH